MNETLKKFTTELLKEFQEQIQKQEFKDFIDKTKAATDSGSFEVIISTADIDRQGEAIDQNGWELGQYKTNPVVLWGHDYWSLPIGITDEIGMRDGKLTAKGRFAPAEANPFAQQVRQLYDLKIVRATSVGFIVKEAQGNLITKAELLEFSFVPVPANPYALSLSKAQTLGIDLPMLATKGLKLETKAEGDACTLEDGTEGILKPDADGNLVCVPKEEEKKKGEIEDQVNEEEKRKQKWAKLNPVWDVFDAFIGVYLDNETPVEDFEKLLDEAIALMKGTEAKGKVSEAKASEKRKKSIFARKDVEQIGAELSAMQSEIDNSIVIHSKKIIEIAQSEYGTEGEEKIVKLLALLKEHAALKPEEKEKIKQAIEKFINNAAAVPQKQEGGEGEEQRDGAAPKPKVETAGVKEVMAGLETFLATRQLLRAVVTAATDSLERMNEIAREKGIGYK